VIAVVDSGNDFSLMSALRRVGGEPVLTADPDVVRRATALVMPGQGAIRDFMTSFAARGLGEAVRDHVAAGRPLLGICVGMQALYDESEENGGCAGLGLLPGRVTRFRPSDRSRKVPHMGWSDVRVRADDPLLDGIAEGAHFYFVHSYYAPIGDETVLSCDYDVSFAAAARRGNVFGVQFHVEKSQTAGLRLLENFVSRAAA
jgi:glutamine amidotransferase